MREYTYYVAKCPNCGKLQSCCTYVYPNNKFHCKMCGRVRKLRTGTIFNVEVLETSRDASVIIEFCKRQKALSID